MLEASVVTEVLVVTKGKVGIVMTVLTVVVVVTEVTVVNDVSAKTVLTVNKWFNGSFKKSLVPLLVVLKIVFLGHPVYKYINLFSSSFRNTFVNFKDSELTKYLIYKLQKIFFFFSFSYRQYKIRTIERSENIIQKEKTKNT